jgi:site-specific recombinase XerD
MPRTERMGDALERYLHDLERLGRRPRTVYQRRKVLAALRRHLDDDLLHATREGVDSWVNRPGLSADTRRHYLAAATDFYGWALERDLVDRSPTVGIRKPKVPRHLPRPVSSADLAAAIAGADDRVALWLRLGALAGLRCCEIAELHAEDVADGMLYVRGQKGGGVGCVPLHPALAQALAAWPVRSGPLWPTVDAHYVSERCNRALRLAGSASTMHSTRHAYATNVYRASGGSLLVAQQLLRHASPATTAIYVQVADENLRTTVDHLHAV